MSKRHLQKAVPNTRTTLNVVPTSRGWVVKGLPSTAARTFETQKDALVAARKLIKVNEGGEVVVRGRDGRVREVDTYTLGEDALHKINAVEGIFLSNELKRDFRLLDRKRLSPEERREWLIAKYGPRRDNIRRQK